MQLRGILLHPSLQAIARAVIAFVMHIAVKCGACTVAAVAMVAVAKFFLAFKFFSFIKHFSL